MADYFCRRCNQWHDADYKEPGNDWICPACTEKREEAWRTLLAQGVADHIEQTRSRYEH